ncbi:MAG: hypothetical protein Q8Q59_00880 [Luteolibacter sp.]|nr:hypothetical protein [Luteolibacter sp.]
MIIRTISICAAVAALVFTFSLSSCSSGDTTGAGVSEHTGHASGSCH